ncbi:MAG: sugar transferase [Clostridiales bacterium]|nr:sugar transferase [Clostridiales bacterium]
MDSKADSRIKHLDFIIIDLLCIELSFVLAIITRYGLSDFLRIITNGGTDESKAFRLVNVVLILAYLVFMLFTGPHTGIVKRGHLKEFWFIFIINAEILFTLFAFLYVIKVSAIYSRLMIGYFFVYDLAVMMLFRTFRKLILRVKFMEGSESAGVLLVAQTDSAEAFIDTLMKNNSGFYHFKGIIFTDAYQEKEFMGIPVIKQKEMLDYIKLNPINDVFMLTKAGGRLASTFINMGITVHRAMDLETPNMINASINQIGNYTVITSTISRATLGELLIKRIFDILISAIGLVFTGILTIILTPIIKLQAPGPVFFKQKRVGKNGKIFTMYKFRSMYIDAEERKKELMSQNEMNGLMFKMENDPRIFPAGNFMRKASIDEFPQFWNIFKGDMSLIGTRPPTLDEYENYKRHHMSRLAMKPGLTGMWQVSGRSDIKDFEEIVRLDNEYIRNFSIGLDIKIFFKTIGTVLGMKGSK